VTFIACQEFTAPSKTTYSGAPHVTWASSPCKRFSHFGNRSNSNVQARHLWFRKILDLRGATVLKSASLQAGLFEAEREPKLRIAWHGLEAHVTLGAPGRASRLGGHFEFLALSVPFLLAALLFSVGCTQRPENLPTYPWTDDQTALRTMAERASHLKTLNCSCILDLTRADGESIRLDGAIAMSIPDQRVRLRAWKFNQAVFDLTLTPDGTWIEMPSDPDRRTQMLPTSVSAQQLARAISLFGPDIFNDPRLQVLDAGGDEFRFRRPADTDQMFVGRVQRSTLVIRQYQLLGPSGHVRFTLDLKNYSDFGGGIVFPTELLALNDGNRIDVTLQQMQINQPLPPRAFVPPRRAEKLQ